MGDTPGASVVTDLTIGRLRCSFVIVVSFFAVLHLVVGHGDFHFQLLPREQIVWRVKMAFRT